MVLIRKHMEFDDRSNWLRRCVQGIRSRLSSFYLGSSWEAHSPVTGLRLTWNCCDHTVHGLWTSVVLRKARNWRPFHPYFHSNTQAGTSSCLHGSKLRKSWTVINNQSITINGQFGLLLPQTVFAEGQWYFARSRILRTWGGTTGVGSLLRAYSAKRANSNPGMVVCEFQFEIHKWAE